MTLEAVAAHRKACFQMYYGPVFTRWHYTRVVRSYGLKQELMTPHCPQQSEWSNALSGQ